MTYQRSPLMAGRHGTTQQELPAGRVDFLSDEQSPFGNHSEPGNRYARSWYNDQPEIDDARLPRASRVRQIAPSGGRRRKPEGADSGFHRDAQSFSFTTIAGERIEFPAEPNSNFFAEPEDPEFYSERPVPAPAGADDDASGRRIGAHRLPAPPTGLKGRAAVVAVAAGAVVAAGQAAAGSHDPAVADVAQAADLGAAPAVSGSNHVQLSQAPQVLDVAAPVDMKQFNQLLAKGQKSASERAAREAAARRPMFAKFTEGAYTSNFGMRWGALHTGVDIANRIGTPIYAVADAEVIEAGPAAGFGMWVRLKHNDGTVTIYGHIDTATVQKGQRVMAGDQIATMGNRGFSTGPHVHFEVWLNGVDKVDPIPWLASRGISLGVERD